MYYKLRLIKLTRLESLNLCYNKVITIRTVIQLTNLTKLGLSCNHTVYHGYCHNKLSIKPLKNLTNLDLSYNDVIENSDLIEIGSQLRYLNLVCNDTISDNSLSTLTNLTSLDLSDNNTITDNSILKLAKLKILKLTSTKISDKSLQTLTNLTELESFYNDQITDDSLSKLTNLIKLETFDKIII